MEGDSNSVMNQKKLLQKYAKENHLENPRYYVDDGYTGTNFNRPGFQKLLEDIEMGFVSTVIVKDMSRLGRDYLQVGYYTVAISRTIAFRIQKRTGQCSRMSTNPSSSGRSGSRCSSVSERQNADRQRQRTAQSICWQIISTVQIAAASCGIM